MTAKEWLEKQRRQPKKYKRGGPMHYIFNGWGWKLTRHGFPVDGPLYIYRTRKNSSAVLPRGTCDLRSPVIFDTKEKAIQWAEEHIEECLKLKGANNE